MTNLQFLKKNPSQPFGSVICIDTLYEVNLQFFNNVFLPSKWLNFLDWISLVIAISYQHFLKNFMMDTCPFEGPLVPLFWTSGESSKSSSENRGISKRLNLIQYMWKDKSFFFCKCFLCRSENSLSNSLSKCNLLRFTKVCFFKGDTFLYWDCIHCFFTFVYWE